MYNSHKHVLAANWRREHIYWKPETSRNNHVLEEYSHWLIVWVNDCLVHFCFVPKKLWINFHFEDKKIFWHIFLIYVTTMNENFFYFFFIFQSFFRAMISFLHDIVFAPANWHFAVANGEKVCFTMAFFCCSKKIWIARVDL